MCLQLSHISISFPLDMTDNRAGNCVACPPRSYSCLYAIYYLGVDIPLTLWFLHLQKRGTTGDCIGGVLPMNSICRHYMIALTSSESAVHEKTGMRPGCVNTCRGSEARVWQPIGNKVLSKYQTIQIGFKPASGLRPISTPRGSFFSFISYSPLVCPETRLALALVSSWLEPYPGLPTLA